MGMSDHTVPQNTLHAVAWMLWAVFLLKRAFFPAMTPRSHMAPVVDEYGGVSGPITLEDVLEEIVGKEPTSVAVAFGASA
jgi:CBS domain containing-hemolysin-like protein